MEGDLTIHFPKGILGFEHHTKFKIFHKEQDNSYIYWLESVDISNIAFALIEPTNCGLHFSLNLTDEDQQILQAKKDDDVTVFLMLAKEPSQQSKGKSGIQANISGPIVINTKKKIGLQKILYDIDFSMNIEEK